MSRLTTILVPEDPTAVRFDWSPVRPARVLCTLGLPSDPRLRGLLALPSRPMPGGLLEEGGSFIDPLTVDPYTDRPLVLHRARDVAGLLRAHVAMMRLGDAHPPDPLWGAVVAFLDALPDRDVVICDSGTVLDRPGAGGAG